MGPNDEFFTPDEVDEQIASLSQNSEQRDETKRPEARVIEHLQLLHTKTPEKYARALDRAWERIVEEHQTAKQMPPEKGLLISMQEYPREQQTLNNGSTSRKRRTFAQQLSILAAVVVIGALVGSMVFILNTARQSHVPTAKHSVQVASGGTPQPRPPHPITGGACTIDTTVAHPQQSKSSLPGLYVFALNGQSDNLLYRYNPQTKTVVWSKKLCTAFEVSGTVEQNGVLYVAGADWTNESQSGTVSYLYALNDADGSAIWGMQFPTGVVPFAKSSPNYGSSPTDLGAIEAPTVVNGIVYVVQRTGVIYALDAATGSQLWTFNAGRNAWATTSAGNGSILEPSNIQVVNGVAYGSIVDRVFALNAQSGKELWMHNFNNGLNINQAPAIANGTLYFTAFVPGYGSVANPDTYVYAFDAQTGTQKWVTAKMRGYLDSPIVLNGGVYVMSYDAVWYTLNPSNGAIEAQRALPSGSGPFGTVAISGVLYDNTGTALAVLNPDGSTNWSVPTTGQLPSIDGVLGGIVYVTTRDSGIYAYSASNGASLWHYAGYLPQPDSVLQVAIVA